MEVVKKPLESTGLLAKNQHPLNQDHKEVETPQLQNTPMKEINGPQGLEPTRYGDWQQKGRCSDF